MRKRSLRAQGVDIAFGIISTHMMDIYLFQAHEEDCHGGFLAGTRLGPCESGAELIHGTVIVTANGNVHADGYSVVVDTP